MDERAVLDAPSALLALGLFLAGFLLDRFFAKRDRKEANRHHVEQLRAIADGHEKATRESERLHQETMAKVGELAGALLREKGVLPPEGHVAVMSADPAEPLGPNNVRLVVDSGRHEMRSTEVRFGTVTKPGADE